MAECRRLNETTPQRRLERATLGRVGVGHCGINRVQRSVVHPIQVQHRPRRMTQACLAGLPELRRRRIAWHKNIERAGLPHAGRAALDEALAAAEAGLQRWRRLAPARREQIILEAGRLLAAESESIAYGMALDQGKPITQGRIWLSL